MHVICPRAGKSATWHLQAVVPVYTMRTWCMGNYKCSTASGMVQLDLAVALHVCAGRKQAILQLIKNRLMLWLVYVCIGAARSAHQLAPAAMHAAGEYNHAQLGTEKAQMHAVL